MPPKVSVVLAVYNGEATVESAARTVLAQTFADFEFLIVDDGSTDSTAAVLSNLAERDPRVRVITMARNVGRSAARNAGIEAAQGHYLAVIDADDAWLPGKLRRQVELLDANPELAFCGSWGFVERSGAEFEWRQPASPEQLRHSVLWFNPFIHCSVVFRKEALQTAGGYDPELHFSEDYDLFLRMMRRGPAANVPEPLVRYRYRAVDPRYVLSDARGKLRVRWRALWRYGYPKRNMLCLAVPAATALLPLRLALWFKKRMLG